MAHNVPTQFQTPADSVRVHLDRLEQLAVKPDPSCVEELLVTLDKAEGELDMLEESGIDVRSERVRWENLLRRFDSQPQLIAIAARGYPGGMSGLRAKHPPAESFWWQADKMRSERLRSQLIRALVLLILAAVVMYGSYWLFTYFFPPDPAAVAYVQASTNIERSVDTGDWEAALQTAEEAIANNRDPELLLFTAAVAERAGNEERAAELRDEARALLPDQELAYWITLGNRRLRVYNAERALEAAEEALALAPEDAEVALLLGRIAIERGDREVALAELDRAYNLAIDSSPQLAVSARVMYADLMRQLEMPDFESSSPVTETTTTP